MKETARQVQQSSTTAASSPAAVSILLPTYNRASFLPAAFEAIRAQTHPHWELVIVDDGSTDETGRVVTELTATMPAPVRYARQENAGPYAARNAALAMAAHPYVAFYDSDDLWLPQHLTDCVQALDANPDVDWVYAACRIVHYGTGALMSRDTFRIGDQPRPFLSLRHDRRGPLRVIDDERVVACAIRSGLYCGLQNSVLRRRVFDDGPFQAAYRNEAEDQLFAIRALKRGHRLGYLDAVHVQYHVHEANSSGSATGQSAARKLAVYEPVVRGFQDLVQEFDWTPSERRELAQRLAREQFWHLGYAVLWSAGRRREALAAYRAGLRAWPWSIRCWKTYFVALVRTMIAGKEASAA
ncbi:MAG: glycosyltransferase family 2 protein [Acidobacteria bacterium]|nr:glycosyltransferase family 2 protein [Acidobacteriota bacterium]